MSGEKPEVEPDQTALDAETVELALSKWIDAKKRKEDMLIALQLKKLEVRRQESALRDAGYKESLAWRALLRARGDLVN